MGVVKWSRDERRFPALTASSRLLAHLARRGLPIAAPIPTLTDEERITVEGSTGPLSIVVQPELSGDWLDVTDEPASGQPAHVWPSCTKSFCGYADQRLPTTSRIEVSEQVIQRWLAVEDHGLAPRGSSRLRQLLVELPDIDREPQLVQTTFERPTS